MPMPKRRKGESRKKFFDRCMGNPTMVKDFPDAKIRGGVCGTAADKKTNMNIIKNIIKNFAIRREEKKGSQFIVVPIIALVEGVHSGSNGPIFYPASEIERTAGDWNGVPLTVPHPEDFGGNPVSVLNPEILKTFAVGTFENTVFFDGKLRGEGWINLERIEEIAPEILHMLQEGVPIEVSTGLFSTNDEQAGNFFGEDFDGTVGDFVPDHLALLPNDEGACSFKDGCGIRNNKKECETCKLNIEKGGEKNVLIKGFSLKALEAMNESELKEFKESCIIFKGTLITNELSHSKLREQLISAVNDMDKPGAMHFLREVFNGHFIFEKIEENSRKLFTQKFSINKDDEIKIKGNSTEVKERIEFIPVDNSNSDKEAVMKKREELVKALIENKDTPYDAEDTELLTNMGEEKFEKVVKFVNCKCNEKKEEKETPEPVTNKEEEKEEEKEEVIVNKEKEKKMSDEELLNNLSPGTKASIDRGRQKYEEEKTFLINGLMKNPRNTFKEEDLKKKDVEELESLCSLAKIPVYLGNNAPDNRIESKETEPDTVKMESYTKLVQNKGKMESGEQLMLK